MDGGAGNFDVSGAASEGKEEEGWIGEMIAPTLKGGALRLPLWDIERERKKAPPCDSEESGPRYARTTSAVRFSGCRLSANASHAACALHC